MKHHERRQREGTCWEYFKVAEWNARSFCWLDGKHKHQHPSHDDAIAYCMAVARRRREPVVVRISRVTDAGRIDLSPLRVTADAAVPFDPMEVTRG